MARKMKPRTPFAERLIAARGDLSRKDFATRLETPLTTLAGWERGVSFPPPEILERIAVILNVSLDWLIAGRGYPSANVTLPPLDLDLLTRIIAEVLIIVAADNDPPSPRKQAELVVVAYVDLMQTCDTLEQRIVGLHALLPMLRRSLHQLR